MFRPHGGEPVDLVPTDFNVRTRVHEYGGGAWFRHGSVVFCSSFDDSRLYRIEAPGSEPQPITPEPPEPHAFRFADGRVFADGRLIVCVRETHGEGEPQNELVVLPTDGSAEPRVIASGRDFYAAPRPSPTERLWPGWPGITRTCHSKAPICVSGRWPKTARCRAAVASRARSRSRSSSRSGARTGCSTSSRIAPAGRISTWSATAKSTRSRARRRSSVTRNGSSISLAMPSSATIGSPASSRDPRSTGSRSSIWRAESSRASTFRSRATRPRRSVVTGRASSFPQPRRHSPRP